MYAHQLDVAQSLDTYDRVRVEVVKILGRQLPDGCFLHMVTGTRGGFRVTEVWESLEAADRFNEQVLRPIIARVAGPEAVTAGPPPREELDLHVLQVHEPTAAAV